MPNDERPNIKIIEIFGQSASDHSLKPLEDRRYDRSEYEPFWADAALDLPLSLHTATQRQGRIHGAGEKTLRDASSRATKAFYPALPMCDPIFSGVFERHPRLTGLGSFAGAPMHSVDSVRTVFHR
jgi:hypothetical protein